MRSVNEIEAEIVKVERAKTEAAKKVVRCDARLEELRNERQSAWIAEGGEDA